MAVTGTQAVLNMPPGRSSEHFCAYSVRVDWTPAEIKKRRDAKGLSQEELGRLLGEQLGGKPISRRAITKWENGVAMPHGRNLRALDHVLGNEPSFDDPPLSQASVMALLGELAARIAQLEAGRTPSAPTSLPPERVRWRTEDAPPTTYEWAKTTREGDANDEAL